MMPLVGRCTYINSDPKDKCVEGMLASLVGEAGRIEVRKASIDLIIEHFELRSFAHLICSDARSVAHRRL